MEELIEVMKEIRDELQEMNTKLDNIDYSLGALKGNGLYDSISDLYEKLDDLMGRGLYNSISDVNEKLESISSSLDTIEINTL
ncbi:T7SS effector LXG polymorphic toxin [Halobacillus yeomjeoni]|uniref:Uncharacterized protein n=1 Tax=Halobacillus yeomjeoni TaxID=311194 RepID=A0A931HY35_9BACI|nr:T7SS effector LXG polymorphic toxin [Halobacillus yeomjeoni]MBH0231386.1 hypothetical protein [Halobacillus yeomjeoni]